MVKYNKSEINFEIDQFGSMHFYLTHALNSYFQLQGNLEVNPFARWSKKNKKLIGSFGVGVKFDTKNIQEELMTIEDDYSDFEYERL
jgi:hypothetical protein